MALYKQITTPSGFTISYWKIQSFELDNVQKTAKIQVAPYVSKESRQGGMEPVDSEKQRITVRDYDYTGTDYAHMTSLDYSDHFSPAVLEAAGMDIYKVMYGYLKTTDFFEGATDI